MCHLCQLCGLLATQGGGFVITVASAPSPAIRGVPLLGDSHVLPGSSSLEPHCVTAFPLVDGYGSPHINGLVRYGLVYLLGRLTRRRMA